MVNKQYSKEEEGKYPLKLFDIDINNANHIYQSQIAIKYNGCLYNLIKIFEIYSDNKSKYKTYMVQYLNEDFDVIIDNYLYTQNINVKLYLENAF